MKYPGGGTDPRKVRVGSPGAKQMKLYLYNLTKNGGLFYIFSMKKGVYSIFLLDGFFCGTREKGGLSGRAYPYTFSMGVPPPREISTDTNTSATVESRCHFLSLLHVRERCSLTSHHTQNKKLVAVGHLTLVALGHWEKLVTVSQVTNYQ